VEVSSNKDNVRATMQYMRIFNTANNTRFGTLRTMIAYAMLVIMIKTKARPGAELMRTHDRGYRASKFYLQKHVEHSITCRTLDSVSQQGAATAK
jgi:hypothetical protein